MRLSLLTRPQGATAALLDGTVTVPGVELERVDVPVLVQGFRRMVRGLEFDVAEMALTTYLVAREHGVGFTALPVPLLRAFHHGAVVQLAGSPITHPKDLEGRRVGVSRGYTVTTGVWARGILAAEHGVDLSAITWVPTGDEHVAAYTPPPNVAPSPGSDLLALLRSGEIDAAVGITAPGEAAAPGAAPGAAAAGLAPAAAAPGAAAAGLAPAGAAAAAADVGVGVGAGAGAGVAAGAASAGGGIDSLLSDPDAAGLDALRTRGHHPINHVVVVRDELLAAHPGLAAALTAAFTESKDRYVERLRSGAITTPDATDRLNAAVLEVTGRDPLPYGLSDNRAVLEELIGHALDQRILTRRPTLESLFAAGTV